MSEIFITGTYRSGSTLVQRILDNHESIDLYYQPLTQVFVILKHFFLQKKQIKSDLPLSHLFMESRYDTQDFNYYLNNLNLSNEQIIILHNILQDNKISISISQIRSFLNFTDLFSSMINSFQSAKDRVGVKEILCEEYIPNMISRNLKCILIIRDPRDMITSLNYGKGPSFTGEIRPTLFNIRNWRKSVAFAIKYKSSKNLLVIKYEDLVNNPSKKLEEITNFLEIPIYPKSFFSKNLVDGDQAWSGNSSFRPHQFISNKSVGNFRKVLPSNLLEYIEILCAPEMNYLEYEILSFERQIETSKIINFQETHDSRKEFGKGYSLEKRRIGHEIDRLSYIYSKDVLNSKKKPFFIFSNVSEELRDKANSIILT